MRVNFQDHGRLHVHSNERTPNTLFYLKSDSAPYLSPAPYWNQHWYQGRKKKTPDITNCPLTTIFQKRTTQQFNQDCSTVNLSSSFLLVLDSCLSCMTCSSLRSMHDPDLKPRRRHSTASPLSFVSPSANCKPMGAQRITRPVFFKDSRIMSTSTADLLSCSVVGQLSL